MTIQQLIEKAIEGGWKPKVKPLPRGGNFHDIQHNRYAELLALLDPEAWKAVGKVEGWDEALTYTNFSGMFKDLWDGFTAEQYLETL